MKKRSQLITISLAMCLMMLLAMMTSIPAVAGENNKSPMRSITEYSLAAHLGILDDDGRLLVWKATLKGDIDGYILWWFNPESPPDLIHEDFIVGFYSARWEIYDIDPLPPDGSGGLVPNAEADLLLAGVSAGQSLTPLDPPGQDAIWDGIGKVTEASRSFRHLIGCIMYEGGPVEFSSFPYYGVGKIRIYPRGFRPIDLLNEPVAETIDEGKMPNKLSLLNNFPNPFNPSTTIEFNLVEATSVKIDIYNNAGQKVETLLDQNLSAGNHSVEWNASDMASGIYFYKIQANGVQEVKRMILVK